MSDELLFVVAPYLCAAVLAFVTIARAAGDDTASRWTPRSFALVHPAIRRHRWLAMGLLGVLVGHVVPVAWPEPLLRWTRDLPRVIAFEAALFAFGVLALAGTLAEAWRRVLRRATRGSLADAAFLGVLVLTLVSGLAVAVAYRWAAAWSAVTVTRYARSLLSLEPDLEPIEALPYPVKLHVFAGIVVAGLFAFTRLADLLAGALRAAAGLVVLPATRAIDRVWTPLRERVGRYGRRVMWPDEEEEW